MKISRLWQVPVDIGDDGKRLWHSEGKLLVKLRVLDELDRNSFETLCRTYDRMCVADKQLQRDGLTIKGVRGLCKHPAFPIWKTSFDNYVTLCKQFGLTPQARGEKVDPKEKTKSKKSGFFDDNIGVGSVG